MTAIHQPAHCQESSCNKGQAVYPKLGQPTIRDVRQNFAFSRTFSASPTAKPIYNKSSMT